VEALRSKLLTAAGVIHAFGTLAESIPPPFTERWQAERPKLKQVHGVAIAELTATAQACGDADGCFTFARGVPAGIMTADCVPLLFARRDGGAVAAVHAGWRGTRAGIAPELWKLLSGRGERAADWVAAVGPTIGPCCYEVSEELATDFAQAFAEFPGAVPAARRLDLPAINAWVLGRLGIEAEILRACTRCTDGPAFHSYRREGGGTRQFSIAMRA
jgi:YfiH family protein